MTPCDEFIQKMIDVLPEICETNDLIAVGIFRSVQSAEYARKMKDCPDYFQLVRRIVYPKNGVIKWLREKKHEKASTDSSEPRKKKECKTKNIPIEARVACNLRSTNIF